MRRQGMPPRRAGDLGAEAEHNPLAVERHVRIDGAGKAGCEDLDDPAGLHQDQARAVARVLLDGFDKHYALFRDCARAARRQELGGGLAPLEALYEGDTAVGVRAEANDGGGSVTVRCKVVADCSGRAAFVGSRQGLKKEISLDTRTAFFSHFENVAREKGEQEGDIQIVAFPHGWFWMIPWSCRYA